MSTDPFAVGQGPTEDPFVTTAPDERTRLLRGNGRVASPPPPAPRPQPARHTRIASTLLLVVFIGLLVVAMWFWEDGLPRDPFKAAQRILDKAPVIDGHIDLPILVRAAFANNVSAVDLEKPMLGHVDIPRLRSGRVGAFFWSVYVGCEDTGANYTTPTNQVRDTLEQIDVARLLMEKYPKTFSLATNANEVRTAIFEGRIAGLLGVEGAHQLGNSLGVLRAYHALGVRYVTLTHSCTNAFADSAGIFEVPPPVHGGLSPLGRALVREMNRLGVLVDLSHVSDDTALQALALSAAPVIWSHSSARAVHAVPRNVPDELLLRLGDGKGKIDGVVMVNFAPAFIAAPGNATVQGVADHVEHIARVAGKKHVGIGSDFDGIDSAPAGLEDVSKYPALFGELYKRGWTVRDLSALAGGNLIRVLERTERVAEQLRAQHGPAMELYDRRPDLPVRRA